MNTVKPADTRRASILRRLGRAYLILTGFLYLFAGLIGVTAAHPGGDLITLLVWNSRLIIKPFPLFPLLAKCFGSASCSIYGFLYISTLEPNEDHFQIFSAGMIALSLVAIWAAFAMKQRNRIASTVWLVLIVSSLFAALANVAADLADWGCYPYRGGNVSGRSIIYVCLAVSYLFAYVLAQVGLAPVKRPANTSVAD